MIFVLKKKKTNLKITVSEETKSEGCFLALSYLAGQEGWSKEGISALVSPEIKICKSPRAPEKLPGTATTNLLLHLPFPSLHTHHSPLLDQLSFI